MSYACEFSENFDNLLKNLQRELNIPKNLTMHQDNREIIVPVKLLSMRV